VFLGEYQHSLDAKGRIILPSVFRGRLEAGLVITKGFDGCLWVMPQADWNAWSLKITERVGVGDQRGRDIARFFFAGAREDRPDKQGRISVPEHLRKHADLGLERDAAVIGSGERIEVWNVERWEARASSLEQTMQENLADLGL
jgi:MraZ protein